MTIAMIQKRLSQYAAQSAQEEENALKEILQEVALSALARTDFFKNAVFHGGSCLRILHGVNRFSEDLDFALKEPDPHFEWKKYLENLRFEFQVYGANIEIQDRSSVDTTVQKMFLKDNSFGRVLLFDFHHDPHRKLRIKFEIDTNPPLGGVTELKFCDFPYPFSVTTHDLPSLFAGKSHALLCREYIKGRDWYDFVWYVSQKTAINYQLLTSAMNQQGPWKGQNLEINKSWYLKEMAKKIEMIDWNQARLDVHRFLKPQDLREIEVWSREFFLDRLGTVV